MQRVTKVGVALKTFARISSGYRFIMSSKEDLRIRLTTAGTDNCSGLAERLYDSTRPIYLYD
jgi:hypothetical protein